jgi:hypothetical protein
MSKIPVNKRTEDVWTYQLESANKIVGAMLLLFFTGFFAIYAIQHNMALSQNHYFIYFLGIFFISALITKKSSLEINRRDKIIKTTSQVLFIKKNKIQSLLDFDSIRISSQKESICEGNLTIVYSLTLSGPSSIQEIIDFYDEEEAKKHLYELVSFLNLRAQGTVHYRSGSSGFCVGN